MGTWHTIIKQHERAEKKKKNVTITAVTVGVGATLSGAMVLGSLAVANKVLESDK